MGNKIESIKSNASSERELKEEYNKCIKSYEEGHFELALKQFMGFIENKNSDLTPNLKKYSYTYIGVCFHWMKEFKKAQTWANEAIKKYPHDDILYANASYVYLELKDYKNALDLAEKSILLNSSRARNYKNGGYIMEKLKNYEEAEKYYLEGVKLDSEDPLITLHLGRFYYICKKDETLAYKYLKKGKELYNKYKNDKTYIYIDLDLLNEMLKLCNKLEKKYKNSNVEISNNSSNQFQVNSSNSNSNSSSLKPPGE